MNEIQKDEDNIETQLADFTEHILNKETVTGDETPFSPDPKLRALEQTAQRLKTAFLDDGPSETVIQRMQQNIAIQRRLREKPASKPFWKKWFATKQNWQPQQSRQRWNMAISLAILITLMVISVPYLDGISLDQPATSGQNLNPGFLIGSVVLLTILAFLLLRRKQ